MVGRNTAASRCADPLSNLGISGSFPRSSYQISFLLPMLCWIPSVWLVSPLGMSVNSQAAERFVNKLDHIQKLQQRDAWKEIRKKIACKFFLEWSQSWKKSWPLVRPLNVPELLSPGQSCLLASKDTPYYMVSLLSEFNPLALVAGLQGQQLRQLPYGWGILLFLSTAPLSC